MLGLIVIVVAVILYAENKISKYKRKWGENY